MKGPGWIFQFDRDRRFLSHSLALDQMLWADCPASDAVIDLCQAGISHLQRLPASITRAAICGRHVIYNAKQICGFCGLRAHATIPPSTRAE
jgi:hypothetical protein